MILWINIIAYAISGNCRLRPKIITSAILAQTALKHNIEPRNKSQHFWIYNYNPNAVHSRSERFFQNWRQYFCFQSALGYSWRCIFCVVTDDRRIGSRPTFLKAYRKRGPAWPGTRSIWWTRLPSGTTSASCWSRQSGMSISGDQGHRFTTIHVHCCVSNTLFVDKPNLLLPPAQSHE
jgi:hypothetical protein